MEAGAARRSREQRRGAEPALAIPKVRRMLCSSIGGRSCITEAAFRGVYCVCWGKLRPPTPKGNGCRHCRPRRETPARAPRKFRFISVTIIKQHLCTVNQKYDGEHFYIRTVIQSASSHFSKKDHFTECRALPYSKTPQAVCGRGDSACRAAC